MRFTDSDGLRVTAYITDTPPGVLPGLLGGLELRHRQHARVEDRIRQAAATGLANLPCHRFDANAAWLEIILAATDLVAWTKLIGFHGQPIWPPARSPRSVTARSDTGRPVTPTRNNQYPNRFSANPPPPTTVARIIEARASCN